MQHEVGILYELVIKFNTEGSGVILEYLFIFGTSTSKKILVTFSFNEMDLTKVTLNSMACSGLPGKNAT